MFRFKFFNDNKLCIGFCHKSNRLAYLSHIAYLIHPFHSVTALKPTAPANFSIGGSKILYAYIAPRKSIYRQHLPTAMLYRIRLFCCSQLHISKCYSQISTLPSCHKDFLSKNHFFVFFVFHILFYPIPLLLLLQWLFLLFLRLV